MRNKSRNVLRKLKNFWKDADAQDLVEYALLLLMVALAVGRDPEILQRLNQECISQAQSSQWPN